MCPLNGENRILVKEGIRRLNKTQRMGLRALIEASGLKNRPIGSHHISFILGPRLNSAGRIDTAEKSLRLLLTDSASEAEVLAYSLDDDNLLRRKFEKEVLEEAEAEIENQINFKEHKIIIVAKQDWHLGVLGIVANKILERFYRPAIVISLQRDCAKGSCRSIKDFHILNALNECKELLLSYGGHASACGFTILKDNLEKFKSQIYKIAYQTITSDSLLPSLEIETELDLSFLNSDLINSIQDLEPYGIGNRRPLFCTYNLRLKGNPVILGKDTLKFYVTDGNFTYPVLGYGMVDFLGTLSQAKRIDLAYHLSLDIWEGRQTIQLEAKDIKID
jgi:single-stranded-DNA-specific exonuclease